jgi:hypothetical protein
MSRPLEVVGGTMWYYVVLCGTTWYYNVQPFYPTSTQYSSILNQYASSHLSFKRSSKWMQMVNM